MERMSNGVAGRGSLKFRIIPVIIGCMLITTGCDRLKNPMAGKNAPKSPRGSSGNGFQTSIEDDISLSVLFADAGDFKYIHPAYSEDEGSGAPWGFKHQGIDLIAEKSGACVLVPADGLVWQAVEYLNPINNQWQVNLHVKYNDRFSYNIMFEPRAHTAGEVALQRAAIRAAENERVTSGDTLGILLNLSSAASGFGDVTAHFDLWVDGRNVCPEPYFKPDALSALLSLFHAKYPDGQLCYPSMPSCVEDRPPLGEFR